MRWIVVALDRDNERHGKHTTAELYRFEGQAEAEQFAEEANELFGLMVESTGGYPGEAYVLDLQDEDSYGDERIMRDLLEDFREDEL